MTDNKSRRMRVLWNRGNNSLLDISRRLGLPLEHVAAYLGMQKGYPGIITGHRAICRGCGKVFTTKKTGQDKHCSLECRRETRRQQYYACRHRSLGKPEAPIPPRIKWYGLSKESRKVVRAARREASKLGVELSVVLKKWKFVPEWRRDPRAVRRDHGCSNHRTQGLPGVQA